MNKKIVKFLHLIVYLLLAFYLSTTVIRCSSDSHLAELLVINKTKKIISQLDINFNHQHKTYFNLIPQQEINMYFNLWMEGGYEISVIIANEKVKKYKKGYMTALYNTSGTLYIYDDDIILKQTINN